MDRTETAETKQCKVVFPNQLNDHGNLFGGLAMQWMDEVAYITATRHTRMKMVTVSTSAINFKHPIRSGTIVEVTGRVLKCTQVKIEIEVEITVEEKYSERKDLAVDAVFTFAAVDDENKPVRIS